MIRLLLSLLSGGFVALLNALAAAINWLFGAWHRFPFFLLTIVAFLLALLSWSLMHQRDDARRAVAEATALRVQEHADLAAAAASAELRAVRNVERVRAEYAAQLESVSHEHQNLLARHRLALADFLHRQPTTAPNSHRTSAANMPTHAAMPGGSLHAAATAELSDPAVLIQTDRHTDVPVADLERCAAAYAGYAALIAAWQALAAIPTTPIPEQ